MSEKLYGETKITSEMKESRAKTFRFICSRYPRESTEPFLSIRQKWIDGDLSDDDCSNQVAIAHGTIENICHQLFGEDDGFKEEFEAKIMK